MKHTGRLGIFILVLLLALAGCQAGQTPREPVASAAGSLEDGGSTTQIEAEAVEHDFRLKLHADNSVYRTDEAIQIWATLEYIGEDSTATIWHSNPYVVFSITDGADFHADGVVDSVLTSTELNRGELYRFDYVKSGSYDASAPDADFWEAFYQEDTLTLPAGTYTISVDGAFYLSDQLLDAEKGPSCTLQITVQ